MSGKHKADDYEEQPHVRRDCLETCAGRLAYLDTISRPGLNDLMEYTYLRTILESKSSEDIHHARKVLDTYYKFVGKPCDY